jgi:hypothetical protein
MRATLYHLLAALTLAAGANAEIISQWNFNSDPPDGALNTGTNKTSIGTGTAALVGGTTATYASGSAVDPAGADNSGWNTTTYPSQGSGNKTRGVQFAVNTEGFESIGVTWEHRNSNTASRYARFQYSLDGVSFIDLDVITTDAGSANLFVPRTVSLNSIAGANNNPNFAFRIVAEFESTATGSGLDQYVGTATGSAYAIGGTWRFDMVTVSGSRQDANTFPTITAISNQTIRVNTSVGPLPFQIADAETPADLLSLFASSSNPTPTPRWSPTGASFWMALARTAP